MADKKTSGKAPAKKTPAKKAPAKNKTAKKAPAKKAPANPPSRKAATGQGKKTAAKKTRKAAYTPEQVYSMIEQAAYFAAENDGFSKEPGAYWAQAEATINSMLMG